MVNEELSPRDKEILVFERGTWHHRALKEEAARELFGMTAVRYHQVLNALIDRDEALRFDPVTVKRLRRLKEQRQSARMTRRTRMYDVPNGGPTAW